MFYSQASYRCAHVGCAAIVATALTMGVAVPQSDHVVAQTQSHLVQLEVALTSAAVNTATAATINASGALPLQSGATVGNAVAASSSDIIGYGIQNLLTYAAATVATVALSPLWYLAFPLTLPASIGFFVTLDQMPSVGLFPGFGGKLGLAGAVAYGIGGFALFPVLAVGMQLGLVASSLNTIQTAIANPSASRPAGARVEARTVAARDSASRLSNAIPAAAKSKRSAKAAAAAAKTSKAASAASKRRSTSPTESRDSNA